MSVSRIVVDDQVEVQIGRHLPVDQSQEGQEVLVAMAFLALGNHTTGGDVQGGERRRAVAKIVMRVAMDIAEAQGQGPLGPVQSLDLDFSSTYRTIA